MDKPYEEHVSCDLCGADDGEHILEKAGTFYVRCRQCGFIYTNPRVADPLESNAGIYESIMQRCIDMQYSRRKQRAYGRMLRGLRRYRKTGRLLEIGSNTGGFLYRARERGWQPVGVEPVESLARYAREARGLEVVASTLENADLPSDSFDVIFSNAVLEHVPSPGAVLRAAARVVRPGGVVYTRTVNYESYTRKLLGTGWRLLSPNLHLSLFTPETLQRFCTRAGLEIMEVHSSGIRTARSMRKDFLAYLKKIVPSVLARFTMKGDRITVLARRPER